MLAAVIFYCTLIIVAPSCVNDHHVYHYSPHAVVPTKDGQRKRKGRRKKGEEDVRQIKLGPFGAHLWGPRPSKPGPTQLNALANTVPFNFQLSSVRCFYLFIIIIIQLWDNSRHVQSGMASPGTREHRMTHRHHMHEHMTCGVTESLGSPENKNKRLNI